MFDQLVATWKIAGLVSERRELTSPKNATWRGYIVKVASLGRTFELTVSDRDFGTLGEGQVVTATGHFDEIGGRLKLIADKIQQVQQGKPA